MEHLKLTFVNVGYGEAIILECPDPRFPNGTFVMVIDGGSAEAAEFADRSTGRIPLWEYLRLHGFNHIDLMVSTHIHEDHLCGLPAAAEIAAPAAFWQTLPPDFDRLMFPLSETLAHNASQDKFLRAINDYQTLCSFSGSGMFPSAPFAPVITALCVKALPIRFWRRLPDRPQSRPAVFGHCFSIRWLTAFYPTFPGWTAP